MERVNLKEVEIDYKLLFFEDFEFYIDFHYIPWKISQGITYVATNKFTEELKKHLAAKYGKFAVHHASQREVTRVIQHKFSHTKLESVKNELKNAQPHFSAYNLFSRNQKILLHGLLFTTICYCSYATSFTFDVFLLIINILFIISLVFKILIFSKAIDHKECTEIDIEESQLPIYSILLPLYKEKSQIKGLLDAIKNINYPNEKKDILLIVEQYDKQTIKRLNSFSIDKMFKIICVPKGSPKTKPRACSYALNFAHGKYLTIYDAEDRPDPNQLLKAVCTFKKNKEDVICLQSRLNYYNRTQGLLPTFFAIEYSIWFDFFLKGLEKLGIPIPLGGSSNHFDLEKIKKLGGWDPYNVAEDADLGYRFAKYGYKTKMLNSTTMEEAPIRISLWLKQRTRWIKGHIQTYFVHLRTASKLRSHFGFTAYIGFHLFLIFPIINYFLQLIVLILLIAGFLNNSIDKFVMIFIILNSFLWVLISWCFAIFVTKSNQWKNMTLGILLYPLYYFLHSIAVFLAIYQILFKPHYWNKTLRNVEYISRRIFTKS